METVLQVIGGHDLRHPPCAMRRWMGLGVILRAVILFGYGALTGCDVSMGPPNHEHHARRWLLEHGYRNETASAIIYGEPSDPKMLRVLAASTSVAVRVVVGRNRYLSDEDRRHLMRDSDPAVRWGVACNLSIQTQEIAVLIRDVDPEVLSGLAWNENVPTSTLQKLRDEYHIELRHFAQNRNCPPSIVREIERSRDSMAKKNLARTRARLAQTHLDTTGVPQGSR